MAEKKKRIVDGNQETPLVTPNQEEVNGVVLDVAYLADKVFLHISLDPNTFTVATLDAEQFMILFQNSIFDGERLKLEDVVGHWVKFERIDGQLNLMSAYTKAPNAHSLLLNARKAPDA